jgi:hypothetical protein
VSGHRSGGDGSLRSHRRGRCSGGARGGVCRAGQPPELAGDGGLLAVDEELGDDARGRFLGGGPPGSVTRVAVEAVAEWLVGSVWRKERAVAYR